MESIKKIYGVSLGQDNETYKLTNETLPDHHVRLTDDEREYIRRAEKMASDLQEFFVEKIEENEGVP